jgi:hypothetical protein
MVQAIVTLIQIMMTIDYQPTIPKKITWKNKKMRLDYLNPPKTYNNNQRRRNHMIKQPGNGFQRKM